ncbi:MAG: ATP-dependent DNA ligase [Pelagibacterales bacterium]|jgi:DNA ligase 1|nr:ATP-dependent DNA ligase [Pelagibacterales bacterium]
MIKPMLAYKYKEGKVDWEKKVYIQPKLDGVRCLISKDGAYSRTGKEFKNVQHIKECLKEFFKACPWAVLDGELYNHELKDDFEKIISLVRKQKPTDQHREDAKKMIQYHVYDYIHEGEDGGLSYANRLDHLTTSDIYCECVKYVPARRVRNKDKAQRVHLAQMDAGYEGSILRLDTPYKHGRSWGLMKFKDFHDAEATIVGYEAGKGKRKGTIGKFLMEDDTGIKFGCPPGKGYTYADMTNMLENVHDYIGKEATFTYFERTKAGSYRHPLFKTLRNYE